MKTYTTYHKIIDLLESAQQASPRMRSFAQGDIVYFSDSMSGNTIQYPLMFATPLAMTYDENTTTYQMSIIFADIVNTDLSNEIDVVSDMELEARSLLSQIKRGSLMDTIDCILPASSSPFFERFNDHVGGVVLDVSLIVFEDINACNPYPSPTVSPSITPTPSITPSITPSESITPTPSITPSITQTPSISVTPTPTVTISPSITPTPTHTPSPTPSGTVTTQYLTAVPQGSNNVDFRLWQNSGHTVTAQALCNITIGFSITGNLGGTATSTTVMATNDHNHQVNINSLIPGETLASVIINSVTPSCGFYNIIY